MKVLAAVRNGALTTQLESQGLEVVRVDSEDALAGALPADAAFAVLDEGLPFAVDLVVKLKAEADGPDRDRMPIVVVGGPERPAVRCVPDAFLEQPTAAQVVEAARAVILRRARQRRLFDQEAILKVPTRPELVEKAGDLLEVFVAAAGYEPEDLVKLDTTIREAVGNAAEHGNKNDPNRTVHINFMRTADRVMIAITDEGPGFDTTTFLQRADTVSALEHTRARRDTESRPGGLGVFIMKQTCDSILFNDAGNTIFLMKLLPGLSPA